MMPQIKKSLQEVRIPFSKMSFTPDVPSTAQGPTEYNQGANVETDVRGIRSMAGDEQILDSLPPGSGAPTFVTANFRDDGKYWFVVATAAVGATPGAWFCATDTYTWTDITPTAASFDGSLYAQNTNITEAWNGTTLFLNDTYNPPMIWLPPPDFNTPTPPPALIMYSNQVPLDIDSITPVTTTEKLVTFAEALATAPFEIGSYVTVTGVSPDVYNGTWLVNNCTTADVSIDCDVTAAYSNGGTVTPEYVWNYEPGYKSVTAGFVRLYNTPNVGALLVAGDITKVTDDDVIERYPTLFRNSQGFLDQNGNPLDAPVSWSPSDPAIVTADETPLPIRGPILDAFPCNGQLFVSSYWDTVAVSPLNFATTDVPTLGARPFNQGRGMLSSNCWANTDKLVYGIDARDIWVFDGQDFNGIGNQRVKNYFFDQVDPAAYDQIFMQTNTQRNQIEIYYADKDAEDGVPNKMLSYRFDLDVWNSPRDVSSATFAVEAPVYSYDAGTMTYTPLLSSRTVVYAQGIAESQLIQKDQGYSFINDTPIESLFRRDNIKLAQDYSTKIMVHRVLPEVVNLGAVANENNEIPIYPSPGEITVTVEGANSVGSIAGTNGGSIVSVALYVDANGSDNTRSPWAQINQNAFRVNSLSLSNSSTTDIWMCNATTWQITEVEDDR
jgi:hypothetical protein